MKREQEILDINEFDYVVVGAGASAMGLLHGLLSRFKEESSVPFTIAVLERGEKGHAKATKTPNQWCDASHRKSCSVALLRSQIGSRIIDVPTGKGIGGSTNIHACLCTPPARDDFNDWPEPWKDSIISSIHVIQDTMIVNNALQYHSVQSSYGTTNPTNFERPSRETKFPSFVDHVPLSIAKQENGTFIRKNYYESLVEPLLRAYPHLKDAITILSGFEVQRLLFSADDQEKVIGVEGRYAVYARREVILCAGAIESPVLLLVSGIGHDGDLTQIGVSRRSQTKSVTGVGRRLRDHVQVSRVFLTRCLPQTLSPNGVCALCHLKSEDGSRYQIFMNDAALFPQLVPHFVASFVRRHFSHPSTLVDLINAVMNVSFIIMRTVLRMLIGYSPLYFILRYFVVTINVALLNPKSTGKVTIRLRSPRTSTEPLRRKDVDVLIDTGYLTDPDDVDALLQGWNMSTHAFEKFLGKSWDVFPGFIVRGWRKDIMLEAGEPWFLRFASQFSLPYFHWCGTCAMEEADKDEWVVDSALRVRGFHGLRVCDASVFPATISGPTALTCAGLGHSLSIMLLKETVKKEM